MAASDKGCRISPGTDPACPGNPTLLGCLCSVSRQGQGGICSPGAVPERLILPGAAVAAVPVPPSPSWQLWELQSTSLGRDAWKTSFFSLWIRTPGCVVGARQPSRGVSVCPKCPPPRAALAASSHPSSHPFLAASSDLRAPPGMTWAAQPRLSQSLAGTGSARHKTERVQLPGRFRRQRPRGSETWDNRACNVVFSSPPRGLVYLYE